MAAQDELAYMPATEIAARIARRDLSPVEVVDAFLDGIARRNQTVNAYVLVLHEEARRLAREAEKAVVSGATLGPLHGLPIAIKDLFDFKAGVPNTFGCKPFKDWAPTVSATYVARLEEAGAIVLGKTNTPEFGHRGITDNYLFGPTSTPFRIGKNAGGSSGGSAAAVAAGLAPLAQGSDGGGSIRIPAAWCGVYGFKASFGRVAAVARPDAFMLAVPFAHAGPIARSVADAALMLGVMSGPDDRDPYSLPAEGADYAAATRRPVAGMRVAWSPELGGSQSALDYRRDDVIRTEVLDALQDVFDECDILVCPTLAGLPVDNATDGNTLGPAEINGHSVDRLLGWCLTYPFNFTGHPAASIPAGLSRDGLPVGLQIAGRRFADETVIAASAAFEQARPWAAAYGEVGKLAGN